MEDALITILESFKYPVYRQGTFETEATYPDTLITYWNTGSPDHSHYDNVEYGAAWSYSIYVYSVDPDITFSLLDNIRTALKAAGWIPDGKGYDSASDDAAHSCRALDVQYLAV